MLGVRGPISPWAREVGLHFAAADGMAPLEARAVTLGAGAVRHPGKAGWGPKDPSGGSDQEARAVDLGRVAVRIRAGRGPKDPGMAPERPLCPPSARGQLYPLTVSRGVGTHVILHHDGCSFTCT